MDRVALVLYACIAIPLGLSLGLLERKSRLTMGFLLIVATVCLFISQVNSLLAASWKLDYLYASTSLTPITEEIAKAVPILFYSYQFSDERKGLMTVSFAEGLGFAVYESLMIFVTAGSSYSLGWAIARSFGAGLMHGICTVMVGYCIAFVKKREKLFVCGTFSLLTLAIIYHSIYNTLVQSNAPYLGLVLPLITYGAILFLGRT